MVGPVIHGCANAKLGNNTIVKKRDFWEKLVIINGSRGSTGFTVCNYQALREYLGFNLSRLYLASSINEIAGLFLFASQTIRCVDYLLKHKILLQSMYSRSKAIKL
jgi:hypothetical protein